LISGSTDPKFSHELYNGHSFTIAQNGVQRMRALAKVMAERYPDIVQWGGIMPDISVSTDSWAVFAPSLKQYYKEKGKDITIMDPLLTKFGSPDFKPQIAQLLGTPIQGLFEMEIGSDGITFLKQAKQFGLWNQVKVVAENSLEITMGKTLGSDMPPDVWSPTHWFQDAYPDVAESNHLKEEFTKRRNDPFPGGIVALGDTAVRAFAAAIAEAKSTETKAVIDALKKVTFKTVNGPARFRPEDNLILNDMLVLHLKPDAAAPNWKVTEIQKYEGASLLDPPTPGVAMKKL
jgi:branched-chain amino acid transport system substrate-binding protein